MKHSLALERAKTKNAKMNITLTGTCITIMLMCGLAVAILPQALLAVAVLACAVLLVATREIWLAFPILIFYYESFGLLFGMSVYRYFTLLFFVFALMNCRKIPVRFFHIVPLFIFALYSILVIAPYDIRRAIFVLLDVVCIVLLVSCFLNNEKNLKKFFNIYVFTALCAFITGVVTNSTRVAEQVIGGELVEVARNYATFEDPNYMGLFYSVAIFAMMALSLFRPVVRAVIAITLTVMILTSLSVTALITNVIFWLVYLFAYRKINMVTFCCFLLALVALVGLYSYGLENPDAPVIGTFSLRIHDKLDSLAAGDINNVTTNRTALSQRHWEYFKQQPVLRMFFGMNAASTIKTDLDGHNGVGHQEYIDLLLNIGLLGTIIYLGVIITRTLKMFSRARCNADAYSGCVFMLKVIWLAYGFALTMFGDYRFMMLFFI